MEIVNQCSEKQSCNTNRCTTVTRSDSGQMTIEFVIAFPAALVIGLIAVNALLFFSECASFDRSFRSLVCVYAPSPAYEQGIDQSCALISESLYDEFSADHLQVEVTAHGVSGDLVAFEGKLQFIPTLFGKGTLSGVFGVSLPPLSHTESIVVDVYKPGVLL